MRCSRAGLHFAESFVETERQLISEDPVPPSSLNSQVPRDLNTICLKCLQKEPAQRHVDAAALIEDLSRFQRNQPIHARRTGGLVRSVKWIRRHPAMSLALLGSIMILMISVGSTLWFVSNRTTTARAVQDDVDEAIRCQRQSAWTDAKVALDRATVRTGNRGPRFLLEKLAGVRRDQELALRFDRIRMSHVNSINGVNDPVISSNEYRTAFQEAGIGSMNDDPTLVAARIRDSVISDTMIGALDDWIWYIADPKQYRWLCDVSRLADRNATAWRASVRSEKTWDDGKALEAAISTCSYDKEPASFLLMMAARLTSLNREAVPFLIAVQQGHPSDFWVNQKLAELMWAEKNPNAIRYTQAAICLRPDSYAMHENLGVLLLNRGQTNEAIREMQRAVDLDPGVPLAHSNLGMTIAGKLHRFDDGVAELNKAIQLDPASANSYSDLGQILAAKGDATGALLNFKRSLSLQPTYGPAHHALRSLLMRKRQWSDAMQDWKSEINAGPATIAEWDGYPEFCLFLKAQGEYLSIRPKFLDQVDGRSGPNVCERTSRACLLIPDTPQGLGKATALIDGVLRTPDIAHNTAYHYFLFTKALADYQSGKFESAIKIVEGPTSHVLVPAPQLLDALAHARLGLSKEARGLLANAVIGFDWRPENATTRETWINHILRRQAEEMIMPGLKAFLQDRREPGDNDERIVLTASCQFENRPAAEARLWKSIFAANPSLLNGNRVVAATAAASAGCGLGIEANQLSIDDCARFRNLAKGWLSDALISMEAKLKSDDSAPTETHAELAKWSSSPVFAGLREPEPLAKLPNNERLEWNAFWKRVNDDRALRNR